MFKVAICDDDKKYQKVVEMMLQADEMLREQMILHTYASGEELLAHAWQQYDLVFLDIQMPGMDGNETAMRLRKISPDLVLVFCSGYHRPTPDSFKAQPFRYIIKDQEHRMLRDEMCAIVRKMKTNSSYPKVTLTADGMLIRLPVHDILYISVAKRGAVVHTFSAHVQPQIFCRETVKILYEELQEEGFVYAHNSYIVNLCHVIQLNKTVLRLEDGTQLNISRSKKAQFDQVFAEYLHKKYKRAGDCETL